MGKVFTAVHETGHAMLWHYAGVTIRNIEIHAERMMGDDEWEGTVTPDPDEVAESDIVWAIMAFYAGPLAEAKRRAELAGLFEAKFDYTVDELDFIHGRANNRISGRTTISFVSEGDGARHAQPLLLASFRSDAVGSDGSPGAYKLAERVERLDVLVPLCRLIRQLLDLPAIWRSVLRCADQLEAQCEINWPHTDHLLEAILAEETANSAHELWKQRERPLWDDYCDWFRAQGRALTDQAIPQIAAGWPGRRPLPSVAQRHF